MSETQGQSNDSPLVSERGVTTISDTVVSSLAGMAAQEVDGVHMGGGASRAAGGVLGSITGSESKTSGISVEIGTTEVAIDLKMGIEYNKNILETVEEVRRRITERVESTTGLRIKELNATITDITFPEKETRRRLGRARPASEPEENPQPITAASPEPAEPAEETTQVEATEPEAAEAETTVVDSPQDEAAEPEAEEVGTAETETTEPETDEAATTVVPDEDSGAPEEAVGVEESPPEDDETVVDERPPEDDETVVGESAPAAGETAELRTEDQPVDEASGTETTEEVQAPPEPETPEARMRRRAAERARRRRRRTQEDDS